MDEKCIVVTGCLGYIGNSLVQRLLSKGYKVVGIDNISKDNMISEMMSYSATKQLSLNMRIRELEKLGSFEFHLIDMAEDNHKFKNLLNHYNPFTVVNLAHMPAAPYSMIDRCHANFTLKNNIIGTNNILWAIRDYNTDCHYITIGTTGEYDHYNNIDIEEGYIQIEHKGRQSTEMIYPRRPGSIYHSSKVASTYLIDFCARTWGLKCTEPQQSIVFGLYTDDIDKTKLYSGLQTDESFGTVLNRFIVQALIGCPLTVYGEGNHKRGFLSLNDSIQALTLAIENPAKKGRVQVWNQLSEWHSMNDVAKMVVDEGKKIDLDVKIKNIPTPRNEYTGNHYYNYISDNLKSLGYKPTRSIQQEIGYVFNLLKNDTEYLKGLENNLIPNITWK